VAEGAVRQVIEPIFEREFAPHSYGFRPGHSAQQAEAQGASELVKAWVAQAGLVLHPDKTRIVDTTQWGGFDFLGWHFERGYQWPREKSQTKLKEKIRQLTPRNSGQAMKEIVARLNRSLRSWRGYFNHGVRIVPERLDQMVRRRLRMLRLRRRGRRGRPNKKVNQLWPNAYFDKLVLWRLAGDGK
jgi:hypothetical protein